ncbi:hypothetical protein ACLOJK_030594 [Asimina triloba]
MDIEIPPSMWPEDLRNEAGKQFNIEKPGVDQDMLEEVTIIEEPSIVDFKRLVELTSYSERGSSQLAFLVKQWEYKQANAVRLLNEELNILDRQRKEVELKKLEILEQYRFEQDKCIGGKRPISILDDVYDIWEAVPRRKNDSFLQNKKLEVDAEYDTVKYWKQRANELDRLLEASVHREHTLQEKLQEVIKNLERQSSPVEELSQILKRADNFLHFVLQNAPVVIGHQDIIGRTDVEIFSGAGVKESQDFKREVMERGLPGKREITFETELFGSKTFLIHVEPVFSKTGETIGVNYMGMDVTDQVMKREKMAKLREQIAETMRAKQMLATMSHEIRSPLTGVVSMAEILANTKLDPEQRQLLDVMLSSGDLVLQLINDILDLSKVESGVMKLEAATFRPREVVKHVLQTAAASLQKELTLEGHVTDDVPVEVTGDVLRIRQILTNLISNAIKFTHEGKVGINLRVVPEQCSRAMEMCQSSVSAEVQTEENYSIASKGGSSPEAMQYQRPGEDQDEYNHPVDGAGSTVKMAALMDNEHIGKHHHSHETVVWLRYDVYDTGIGIPVVNIQVKSFKFTDILKSIPTHLIQVELMGGHLTVTSQEHHGSTFTFALPCKVSPWENLSDDPEDGLSSMADHEVVSNSNNDGSNIRHFQFHTHVLGSSGGSLTRTKLLSTSIVPHIPLQKENILSEDTNSFSSESCALRRSASLDDDASRSASIEDTGSRADAAETATEIESLVIPETGMNEKTLSGKFVQQNVGAHGLIMTRHQHPSLESSYTQSGRDSQLTVKQHAGIVKIDEKNDEKNVCSDQKDEKSVRNSLTLYSGTSDLSKSTLPKILLVEDNKINVMVTQSMMKQLGHSIDVVNNGLEAVHAVQTCKYDLVLMDVCMPIMDGLQATRLIRSFEENQNWDVAVEAGIDPATLSSYSLPNYLVSTSRLPIIAMTANALAESAAECLASGMDSFVSKPVTFQKLKQCLQQYLPSENL